MRRLIVKAGLAVAFLAAASASAPAQKDSSRHIIDEINARAFTEFRNSPLGDFPDRVAMSPVARWYTRFIVSFGTAHPPSPDARAEALAFTSAFSNPPNRTLRNHIWVDDTGTSYNAANAALLNASISAASTSLHWSLDQESDAPADALMVDWILRNDPSIIATGPASFLQALNFARYSHERSNHPFNALTLLSERVSFNLASDTGSVQTMNRDGLRGFRIGVSDAPSIVYLFYGTVPSIRKLQSSLDPSFLNGVNWGSNEGGLPSTLSLDVTGAEFFNPDAGQTFDTWLNRPLQLSAEDWVRLHIDKSGMFLSALTGIEGQSGNPDPPLVDISRRELRAFNSAQPVICIIVDKETNAITFLGGTVTASRNPSL
jgi:hypothetical protein